eukprot:gene428-1069_t
MNHLQSLLQDSLIATGNVEHCAIIRRKDSSLRASSVGFSITPGEIEDFIEAFKHPTQTREDGLTLNNIRYKCVRADKFSIYGKKDTCGVVLVKTATLILLGSYGNNMFPSICVEAMEKLEKKENKFGKEISLLKNPLNHHFTNIYISKINPPQRRMPPIKDAGSKCLVDFGIFGCGLLGVVSGFPVELVGVGASTDELGCLLAVVEELCKDLETVAVILPGAIIVF